MEQKTDLSEAEIAVHWPEEGYYQPPVSFIARANLTDGDIFKRFSVEKVHRVLQGIRRPSDLVQVLGDDAGYEQCAVLAMAHGR